MPGPSRGLALGPQSSGHASPLPKDAAEIIDPDAQGRPCPGTAAGCGSPAGTALRLPVLLSSRATGSSLSSKEWGTGKGGGRAESLLGPRARRLGGEGERGE